MLVLVENFQLWCRKINFMVQWILVLEYVIFLTSLDGLIIYVLAIISNVVCDLKKTPKFMGTIVNHHLHP
jgi:hypothetical protein